MGIITFSYFDLALYKITPVPMRFVQLMPEKRSLYFASAFPIAISRGKLLVLFLFQWVL